MKVFMDILNNEAASERQKQQAQAQLEQLQKQYELIDKNAAAKWERELSDTEKRTNAAVMSAQAAKAREDRYSQQERRALIGDKTVYTLPDGREVARNYTDAISALGVDVNSLLKTYALFSDQDFEGMDGKDREDLGRDILARVYDEEIIDGRKVAKIKPGGEAFIKKLGETAYLYDKANSEKENARTLMREREDAGSKAERKKYKTEEQYKAIIKTNSDLLTQLEATIKAMLAGQELPANPNPNPNPGGEGEGEGDEAAKKKSIVDNV